MNNKARLKGLYGITDRRLMPDTGRLLKAVQAALHGGMNILQYRDKHLPYEQQLEQAGLLKQLCRQHGALFIINDNVGLALEAGADGVHLGRQDQDINTARERLGSQAIIGCSCYNRLELARQSCLEGADYVAFGRFFPSNTKPDAVQARPELLDQARPELDCPLCVIGGITTDNAPHLISRGADMVAVIQGLFAAPDIELQANRFSRMFV